MDRAPDFRFAGTAPGARRVLLRRTVVSSRMHYGQSIAAAAGFGINRKLASNKVPTKRMVYQ